MAAEHQQMSEGFGYAKALIFGEYAVMYGAPCMVVALNRRLVAKILLGAKPRDAFAQRMAQLTFDDQLKDACIEFENSAFFSENGSKLGIGSSAAAVVASCEASTKAQGKSFGTYLDCIKAIQAHRLFQGGVGSGADIIASLFGGIVLVRDCPHAPQIVRLPKACLPPCCLIAMRGEAATTSFVNAALSHDQDQAYQKMIQRLSAQNQAFSDFILSSKTYSESYYAEFLNKIRDFEPILAGLQQIIGRSILTSEFIRLRKIADQHDAAIKTSGAGGGDIAVVFAKSSEALARFIQCACAQCDVLAIPVDVAPERGFVTPV